MLAAARPSHVTPPPPALPIDVLIVDDDPDFLDLLVEEIGHIPHVQITAAHDPREALERLSDPRYKLVVSDWALDDSTGGELLRRADGEMTTEVVADKTPVLFISGSEKVNETHCLHTLRHFEPVSFVLKRCGPPMIGRVAEHILERFALTEGGRAC